MLCYINSNGDILPRLLQNTMNHINPYHGSNDDIIAFDFRAMVVIQVLYIRSMYCFLFSSHTHSPDTFPPVECKQIQVPELHILFLSFEVKDHFNTGECGH